MEVVVSGKGWGSGVNWWRIRFSESKFENVKRL